MARNRYARCFNRQRLVAAIALLCVGAPALATQTKSSGDWLDPLNWTLGNPGPADGAIIAGHSMWLHDMAGAATLRMDGALDIKEADAPSSLIGSLTIAQTMIVGDAGAGWLQLRKGGKVRSRDTYIGNQGAADGLVTIGGDLSRAGQRSSWTNTGELFVGSSGFLPALGAVNVFDGATVSTYNTRIGAGVSKGTVALNNASWTNSNLFTVGSGGPQGTLAISARGVLSSLTGVIGYGAGSNSTGTGTQGTASVDNGTWTNSGDFHVGSYARGMLTVRSSGVIENTIGYIGFGALSVGEATISDSTWTNRGALNVGYNGRGSLLINQRGTVTSSFGILGAYGKSTGTVTVDNATWANSSELYVGYGLPGPTGGPAEGHLTVRNGGIVTATSALIGNSRDSLGSVTVAGSNGSQAAQWRLSGDLHVGSAGRGTLNVGAGGVVSSRSTFLGYQGDGKLQLDGTASSRGTLETQQLSGGTGAGPQNGTLTFDGGLLRATAQQVDFVRNIGGITVQAGGAFIDSNGHRIGTSAGFIGSGGVNKLGVGVLDLRGTSALGGLSSVQAGTLLVNGSLSGDVRVDAGATLGGSGQIEGRITVLPGGTLSPGNSPGTLTATSLVLSAGSTLAIELDAPGDRLVVLDHVTLAGRIDFSGDPSQLVGSPFLSYGGTLLDLGIVIGSLPGGLDPADFVVDFSTPGMLGVVRAVPEPASVLLLALGASLLGLRRMAWRHSVRGSAD